MIRSTMCFLEDLNWSLLNITWYKTSSEGQNKPAVSRYTQLCMKIAFIVVMKQFQFNTDASVWPVQYICNCNHQTELGLENYFSLETCCFVLFAWLLLFVKCSDKLKKTIQYLSLLNVSDKPIQSFIWPVWEDFIGYKEAVIFFYMSDNTMTTQCSALTLAPESVIISQLTQ